MIGDAVAKVADDVVDGVSDKLESVGLKIVLGIAAGFAVLGAVTGASFALYWWLSSIYGPVTAALMVSAVFAILSVVLVLAAKLLGGRAKLPEIEPSEVASDEAEEAVKTLGPMQFIVLAAGIGALIAYRVTGSRSNDGNAEPGLLSSLLPALSLYSSFASSQAARADTTENASEQGRRAEAPT